MEAARSTSQSSVDHLRDLYRFMASRDFVASRDELRQVGFSKTRIESWIRRGRLVKVARAVYAYGRDIETTGALYRTALLVAGPESVLISRSACEMWGIVQPKPGMPRLVQVGSPRGQSREFQGLSPSLRKTIIKVARRELQPADIRQRNRLRVVRPAMALVGFASEATAREIRFAFLEACRLKLFGEQDLGYCFTRLVHHRGSGKLRPYLSLWVPELSRIRSVYEGWFLLVWIERGYPMPKVNDKVLGREVDLCWMENRFALELDGKAFHDDPVQIRIDQQKQAFLESNGMTVERLPYKIFERDPVGEVDRIARQIGFSRTKRPGRKL